MRVSLAQLALLPLLGGPGGLADIIDGVAELPKDARVQVARLHRAVEPHELGARFLQAEIDAPESFTRNQKLDCHTKHTAVRGTACADNPRPKRFARKEVGQIKVAANAGINLHLQKAALSVYLDGVGCFFDVLAASLLPLGLNGNNDGKADTSPLLGLRIRRGFSHLVRPEGHLQSRRGTPTRKRDSDAGVRVKSLRPGTSS